LLKEKTESYPIEFTRLIFNGQLNFWLESKTKTNMTSSNPSFTGLGHRMFR